jgi:hypothetical protein
VWNSYSDSHSNRYKLLSWHSFTPCLSCNIIAFQIDLKQCALIVSAPALKSIKMIASFIIHYAIGTL